MNRKTEKPKNQKTASRNCSSFSVFPFFRFSVDGLTLVELLVVMALFTLVAGTLSATCSGGLAVWERFETAGLREQWLQTTLEQFRRDVHQVRRFQPVAFDGAYDAVAFPAVVSDTAHPERSGEIGQLGYYWDRRHERLCRAQHPYRLLSRARLTDTCQTMAEGVERVRFSFYVWDPSSEAYAWSTSWSDPEPPLAVKVELTYADQESRRNVTHALVVPVPIAAVGRPGNHS